MTRLERLTAEPGASGEWAREVLADDHWAEPPPGAEAAVWANLSLSLPALAGLSTPASAPDAGAANGCEGSGLEGGGSFGGAGAGAGAPGVTAAGGGAGVATGGLLAGTTGATLAKLVVVSALAVAGGTLGWQLGGRPPLAGSGAPDAIRNQSTARREASPLGVAAAAAPARDAGPDRLRERPVPARPPAGSDLGGQLGSSEPRGSGATPARNLGGEDAVDDRAAVPGGADSELGEESALLAEARAALRRGALAESSRHLNAYGARFPGGRLVQEREALRIEVLWRSGSAALARQELADYGRRFPDSPHAARLARLLLGDGDPTIGK